MAPRAHSLSRRQVKENVRYSVYEGMAASAAEGATDDYYTPYALAAGASLSQLGWLVTLQQLLASFCYLKFSNLASVVGSRKRLMLILVLTDVITFLPFIVVPYFLSTHLVEAVFFCFVLAAVPSVVTGPVWASWITDLVPSGIRGRYFGLRSTLAGAAGLACFVVAGLVLNHFHDFDGFALVFGFAAFCRLTSWTLFWRMDDIPIKQKESRVSFGVADFQEAIGSGRFGKFMVYSALFYFAVYLSHPFVAAFMLQDLGFSYRDFMVIICASEVAKLCIYRFWGKYADATGNLRVVKIASCVIPVLPLFWMVSHNIYYLIGVQIINGLAWAGFELCSPNFVYSALPANNRIKFIACYRALNGAGIALGALVGGYLATHMAPLFGHTLLALFLVSGLARGLVAFRLLPSIVDVARKRPGVSPWAYKVKWTPVHRPAVDNAAWALLYAPMGQKIGDALGAKHVLTSGPEPERHGLFYDRSAHFAAGKSSSEHEAKPRRARSNFDILRGAFAHSRPTKPDLTDAPRDPERKGLFYARVWRGLKNLVGGKEEMVTSLQAASKKLPLLYDKAAWRGYLNPVPQTVPGKGQGAPGKEVVMPDSEKRRGPGREGAKTDARDVGAKPAEGVLHKPAEWAAPGPESGKEETAGPPQHEALLHKPSGWERPAPPEPPKGRPEPEHKGAFYDPAKQQAILKETGNTSGSDRGNVEAAGPPQHEGLLHKPSGWERPSPPEPPTGPSEPDHKGAFYDPAKQQGMLKADSVLEAQLPEAKANAPHREPLLHKPDGWDRFTEKKGAPDPKKGRAVFRPPGKAEQPPTPPAPTPRGLLHRPDSWPEEGAMKKPNVTKDGLPIYPRKKRPQGGKGKR